MQHHVKQIQTVEHLLDRRFLSFDTETYGLNFNDRAFCFQFATDTDEYYLDSQVLLENLEFARELFGAKNRVWFIHNAKFDMRRLELEGLEIKGGVHCTMQMARHVYNQHLLYSLDAVAKRVLKVPKDSTVEDYIADNKLWEWEIPLGSKTRRKKKFYHKVPFDIMFKYGCKDVRLTYDIGINQFEKLNHTMFYNNELELQKACYKMESIGMTVRRDYAEEAYEYELYKKAEATNDISRISGDTYSSGPIWLRRTFDKLGIGYRVNPKTGNPVFNKQALESIDHELVDHILAYRRHEKYANTYYGTYKKQDTVHASIKTGGTDTGRFSYAEPNLQNVPKEDELDASKPFQVRSCFAPRPGYCLVPIDYDQQEFRLLLDYAGEKHLISQIINEGLDVHQATADMVGVTRKQAKTLNFGLLYGMGVGKLSTALGLQDHEAKLLRQKYFSRLPRVKRVISDISKRAETRGYIKTWCGRRLYFPDKEFAYKAPNHLIQGGCADIVRFAIVKLDKYLQNKKSRMLVQVHDEILFEVHEDELHIVDDLRAIMENVYQPRNGMYLTCAVEHSWKSWGKRDIVEGKPVSNKDSKETESTAERLLSQASSR